MCLLQIGTTVGREDFDRRVSRVGALAEPVRRALYRYVVGQPQAVSREQAAEATGVAVHAAKFHLDKLEQEGLLEAEFHRAAGRRGPGAGRPAKHYKRSGLEVEVSLPERRYDLAGHVMAQAIATSQATGTAIADALRDAAVRTGRELGSEARARAGKRLGRKAVTQAVSGVLADNGYEPRAEDAAITLANCPFHALAEEHRALVCGMNLDLVEGLLEGLGDSTLAPRLDPAPGRCCVTIGPAR